LQAGRLGYTPLKIRSFLADQIVQQRRMIAGMKIISHYINNVRKVYIKGHVYFDEFPALFCKSSLEKEVL